MADTVMNPALYVFTKWAEVMKDVVGEGNYSMDSSSMIASAPYARLYLMSAYGMRWDLEGDEVATNATFQVECFSQSPDPIEKVYAYDDASHKLMTSLGFRRQYGPALVDNADSRLKRVISRYNMTMTNEQMKDD